MENQSLDSWFIWRFALCRLALPPTPQTKKIRGWYLSRKCRCAIFQLSYILEAFRAGLRKLGYVDGKNINIEYRYAEGK